VAARGLDSRFPGGQRRCDAGDKAPAVATAVAGRVSADRLALTRLASTELDMKAPPAPSTGLQPGCNT
jgi:hypothetical protein